MQDGFASPNASIIKILNQIEDSKLYLPEFQRPYTWSIEQNKDLFDSIIRGIFIGAFIFSKPKFELTCREINKNPREGVGKNKAFETYDFKKADFFNREITVVLDGQQRITSLYRVLHGIDKLYFVFKDYKFINWEDVPNSLEDFIEGFSSKKSEVKFCVDVDLIFYHGKNRSMEGALRSNIFEPCWNEFEIHDEKVEEKYFQFIIHLKSLFYSIIEDKTLLSVFLLEMSLEKLCMFFERSNSKGVSLNFIDIITAKIYKGFKLKKEKEIFNLKNPGLVLQDSVIEAIVRFISYIEFKKPDKNTILSELTANSFNKYWLSSLDLYKQTINFLNSESFLINPKWLKYKIMLIPIMYFLSLIPHKSFSQMTAYQSKVFFLWFYASLINNRYGGGIYGSSNYVITEDCKMFENLALKKNITYDYFKKIKIKLANEDLWELSNKNSSTFIGIISLLNYKSNFKQLENSNKINFNEEIQIHHIFPTRYILDKYKNEDSFERLYSNSIVNKTSIEKITNLKVGRKSPGQYLNQPPINENDRLADSLSTHIIPNPDKLISGDYDNQFKEFLEDRTTMIYEIIKKELLELQDEFIG